MSVFSVQMNFLAGHLNIPPPAVPRLTALAGQVSLTGRLSIPLSATQAIDYGLWTIDYRLSTKIYFMSSFPYSRGILYICSPNFRSK